MATSKDISNLVINKVESQQVYDYMVQNNLINEDELYLVEGAGTSSGGTGDYVLPVATSSTLGGVKIGSNITVSSGTISLSKSNVTNALGYTPPTTNTTYGVVSTSADGLAPKRDGSTTKFLRGDGTWAVPPDTNTTYSAATTSAAGLMSASDKSKLDGIASGANNYTYTLPTAGSSLGGVKTTSTVTSTSGLTACPIISGVPYYKDTNTTTFAASAITSGTLGIARGGTGKSTHTSNAILTGNGTSAVNNVATANGAFYATSANGAAKFGTLPIAQGGTGATSVDGILQNLGFDIMVEGNIGLGTRDTTNTISDGFECQWIKYGKIVYVYFTLKTNTSATTAWTKYQMITGLPKALSHTPGYVVNLFTGKSYLTEVDTNGNLSIGSLNDNIASGYFSGIIQYYVS